MTPRGLKLLLVCVRGAGREREKAFYLRRGCKKKKKLKRNKGLFGTNLGKIGAKLLFLNRGFFEAD